MLFRDRRGLEGRITFCLWGRIERRVEEVTATVETTYVILTEELQLLREWELVWVCMKEI